MSGIILRLGEKEERWSRTIGVNERMHMLHMSINCTYLDVCEDFVDSFELYKKDSVHLNDKGTEVFPKGMDKCLSLCQETRCYKEY